MSSAVAGPPPSAIETGYRRAQEDGMTTIRIGTLALALALTALASCTKATESTASAAAPSGSIAGAWSTRWGTEVCSLTLQQSGTTVTGNYTTTGAPPGTVNGTLAGNVLTGTWGDSAGGGGGLALTFSADGRSFTGTWGSGSSTTDGGPWTGTR